MVSHRHEKATSMVPLLTAVPPAVKRIGFELGTFRLDAANRSA